MNLFSQIANIGLNAKARFTSANISGTPQIGANSESVALSDADVAYTFEMLLIGAATTATVDLASNTDGDDFAWEAGTAQVETATAAGTIGTAGNAEVIVTAAGMTGSPKTISVAVSASDAADVWAGKVRTALAADADVSALYDVSGTTTSIVLTRKPAATFAVGTETVNKYAANDATLNISLDNDTCTGITTAATSTNTTAGVATSGVYAPDVDGTDFEGEAIPLSWDLLAIYASGSLGDATMTLGISGASSVPINADDRTLNVFAGSAPTATGDLTITTGSADSVVEVTVIGQQ